MSGEVYRSSAMQAIAGGAALETAKCSQEIALACHTVPVRVSDTWLVSRIGLFLP